MPKKIEITAFEFTELSPKVQEELLDKYRYVHLEFNDDWHQPIIEGFNEDMVEFGITPDVKYSGFGLQGDGASFTTDTCDTDLLIRKLYESGYDISETALLDSKNLSVQIDRSDNHYYHEYTMLVDVHDEGMILSDTKHRELTDAITDWARTKARELYKKLETYYDELSSDEEVMEYFKENEFLFFENGKVIVRNT